MTKKMILSLTIIIVAIMTSCTIPTMSADLMSVYDIPEFETPKEAMNWVHDNIRYVPENAYTDNWQTPEETLQLGTGDCEDMAALVVTLYGSGEIVGFVLNDFGHMVSYIDGNYYDVTLNRVSDSVPINAEIIKRMSLESYMMHAVVR